MMSIHFFAVPWYGLAAMAGVAAAQSSAVTYESAYTDYKPYREESLSAWREMNDEAARIGGHAGIFRAATSGPRQGAPSEAAPAEGRAHDKRPAGDPHSRHHQE